MLLGAAALAVAVAFDFAVAVAVTDKYRFIAQFGHTWNRLM